MVIEILVDLKGPPNSALLWFDCILTFQKEVQCMWRHRFTGATVVYLAMRYIAVVERVILVLMGVLWTINDAVVLFGRIILGTSTNARSLRLAHEACRLNP